jgi:hypothetical protein
LAVRDFSWPIAEKSLVNEDVEIDGAAEEELELEAPGVEELELLQAEAMRPVARARDTVMLFLVTRFNLTTHLYAVPRPGRATLGPIAVADQL